MIDTMKLGRMLEQAIFCDWHASVHLVDWLQDMDAPHILVQAASNHLERVVKDAPLRPPGIPWPVFLYPGESKAFRRWLLAHEVPHGLIDGLFIVATGDGIHLQFMKGQ